MQVLSILPEMFRGKKISQINRGKGSSARPSQASEQVRLETGESPGCLLRSGSTSMPQ